MSHLTVDMLGLAKPTRVQSVPVPEFGPGVEALFGEMSAVERDERIEVAWIEYCKARGAEGNDRAIGFTAFAVAASLCDPQRNFAAADVADIPRVAKKFEDAPAGVVTRCFLTVSSLQGLSKEDVAALEKKLLKTPSTASDSASSTGSDSLASES